MARPRSKAKGAGRVNQQDYKIAARARAAAECLNRGLRLFGVPALIRDSGRNAAVQVGQQSRRIGRVAPNEAAFSRDRRDGDGGVQASGPVDEIIL